MKWIGQHIWDFISRFRSDVYLEGTESGTIASGGNLGLDSNNKIVKATGVSSASTVTVTDSNANTAFPVVFHDESNNLLDDTGTLTYTPFSRNLNLSHSSGTVLSLTDTGNTASDSHIYFKNSRGGGASSDGDNLGTLTFQGHNDAGANIITYADFTAYIESDSASNEAGAVKIQCRYQGGINPGLQLYGSNSSSRIDAEIGHGTASLTTIAGDLDINGGSIQQTNATAAVLSIINSGDNNVGGNIILRNSGGGVDMSDNDSLGAITFSGLDDGTPSTQDYARIETTIADVTSGQEAGKLEFKVAEYDGTLTTGLTLDGDTDADGEIDVTIGAGTASTTTIAGDLTLNGDTITSAADLNIVATGNDINVDTDNFTIESATSQKPHLYLKTTVGSNKPSTFSFIKDKGAAGADSDYIGYVIWTSDNDAQEQINFAEMYSQVRLAADGAEEGKLAIGVKNTDHASLPRESFSLVSNGANTDVNLGYGSTSTTTIAGDLDIDGDAITSAAALTITPADVSGVAFRIDADADTDNEVQIDAGILDLNATATATLDAATSWTVTSPEIDFKSSTSSKPVVEITNSTNDATSATIKFDNTHGGNNGAYGDWLGIISFYGNDAVGSGPPNSTEYARIYSRIDVATDGQESGSLHMEVANHDGDLGGGLTLTGGSADNEIDVSIGLGLDSLTTIAGDTTVSGNTLTIGHDDGDVSTIKKVAHSDGAAGRLYIQGADATAGQTDTTGGPLNLFGGQSTGTGEVGAIGFYGGTCAASTGSSLNSNLNLLSKIQAITGIDNYTSQKWFEGGGMGSADYFAINTYQHGETHLITHDQSSHAADLLINVDGSITLDAHTSHDIYFHENGVERIQWHMDSTPTMEVTGDFTIDGSGDIEINADGGDITFKDDSTTLASMSAKGIVGNRKFTKTSDTHFEYQGDVLYLGDGSTTQGNLCYLKEDGEWGDADADGAATGDDADRDAMGMLAIALGSDPDADGMLIRGIITMDDDMGDVGNPIYVSTTAGDMTSSQPTASGDFVRVVGYCLDDSNGQIYFNPDNTWVEIA